MKDFRRAEVRRKDELIDELIEICLQRGITNHLLEKKVRDASCRWYKPGDPHLEWMEARSAQISAAGVTAQLYYLLEAWGEKRLRKTLMKTGGVLDALSYHTSSTPPAEREELLGRHNVDEDGDVTTSAN